MPGFPKDLHSVTWIQKVSVLEESMAVVYNMNSQTTAEKLQFH